MRITATTLEHGADGALELVSMPEVTEFANRCHSPRGALDCALFGHCLVLPLLDKAIDDRTCVGEARCHPLPALRSVYLRKDPKIRLPNCSHQGRRTHQLKLVHSFLPRLLANASDHLALQLTHVGNLGVVLNHGCMQVGLLRFDIVVGNYSRNQLDPQQVVGHPGSCLRLPGRRPVPPVLGANLRRRLFALQESGMKGQRVVLSALDLQVRRQLGDRDEKTMVCLGIDR
mmetsp:Transcript_57484/g.123579  ORF Transcript_57484/g.123579 Transcript_57484/m.123579 type:complete len:230 (+) Transcript_57484:209-898(+)